MSRVCKLDFIPPQLPTSNEYEKLVTIVNAAVGTRRRNYPRSMSSTVRPTDVDGSAAGGLGPGARSACRVSQGCWHQATDEGTAH